MAFQPQHPLQQKGFTLVELMVVVVIIGIMLTTVVFTLGDKRLEQLEDESRRVVALLGVATEEAILQSQELAFVVEDGEYRFLRLDKDNNKWLPLNDDSLLRARAVPSEMKVEVSVENMPPALLDEEDSNPRVFILSSGEMTPFELDIRNDHFDDKRYFRLSGNPLGEVSIEGPLE